MMCNHNNQSNHQQVPNYNNNNNVNTPAHQASMSWYSGYHQGAQMYPPANAYYMYPEEQNMWNHHHYYHVPHHAPQHVPQHVPQHQHSPPILANEYADVLGYNNYIQSASMHALPVSVENQIPSPPSGSEMSSSSTSGHHTPPARRQRRSARNRTPYDWMKKPSYQNKSNPELDCLKAEPVLLDFTTAQETHGKTRTKDKYRVVYSDVQRVELEREFHFHNRYITIRRKGELAIILGLSERQIKIWFQNRRAKERKQLKKAAEEEARELNNANHNSNMINNNQDIPSYEGMVNQHVMQPNNPLPAEQLLPVPESLPILQPSYPEEHDNISNHLLEGDNQLV